MTFRVIESYVHQQRIGVLVELSTESDFAARTDEFRDFSKHLAMHVAAMAPGSTAELLEQMWVVDGNQSVADSLEALTGKLAERVRIERYVRWTTGPGGGESVDPPGPPAPVALLGGALLKP